MSWVRFHPLTRIVIAVAIVLGVALVTGFERVGQALANISPRGSFETRCDALPAGSIDVSLTPVGVVENMSLDYRALSQMTEAAQSSYRTVGLTRANFGHRSSIEVKGIEDRFGHRACVTPRVHVELYFRHLTVYIARDYADDPCKARVIREHEQRHVDIYRAYAKDSLASLPAQLRAAVGHAPYVASTVTEAQALVDRQIGKALDSFMRDSERVLAERQAEVDTPEEYARVSSACGVATR
ncbi:MAG TPA: hypothetical protein VNE58_16845 [Casimicrobiaceae bacterium]|nr:hypothetical protein [Casimicrobiaceae bacterium]